MPLWALVFSALAGAALALGAVTTPAAAIPPSTGTASGGPGAASCLDVARKDCVGTAHNTTSKVWFTVANGVLSGRFQSHARERSQTGIQPHSHYIRTQCRARSDSLRDERRSKRTHWLAANDFA